FFFQAEDGIRDPLVTEVQTCALPIFFSGDGTYNEAINGAAGRIPFGFIAGGGASVLPRALGLPRDHVAAGRQIASALAAGRTRADRKSVGEGKSADEGRSGTEIGKTQ